MSQLTKISKTHSSLERIFNDEGFVDYKWITPEQIVVAQWVRMKCMFGFPNYGHKGTCPSQTPSVPASERFFNESWIQVTSATSLSSKNTISGVLISRHFLGLVLSLISANCVS